MAKEIDEKVVEMRFDNQNFEKNVSKSMSTLDKLKASLKMDGAAKSFEDLERASSRVSFEKMANGIEALQKRFSTFGIVGMRVIENITDSMMNFVGKTTSFVKEGVAGGGIRRAMNLENAQFQLQGLLKDEEKVAAVMKNVGDAVDGTAYSLDSAAKVASQLAASSIEAGDGMFTALRAVAGVAAMTNSEYDDIGRIFTTVAGQGRLMADQLNQLSARGMNAAATIAEYLGVTEAEVREMTSKGKISFEMFAQAMDSAFGEHAKAANKTFTGSLSNIKAALARIGAEFVSPLVVQEGPLVNLFNKIREKINEVKASIGPFAETFTTGVSMAANALTAFLDKLDFSAPIKKFQFLTPGSSMWSSISQTFKNAGISAEDFQNVLIATAKKHGIAVDEIIEAEGSLDKAMSSGKISKSVVVEALKAFADSATGTADAVAEVTEKVEDLSEVVNRVIRGDFGNGADRVKALTDAGYDYATVQDLVNKTLAGETVEYEKMSDAQLKSLGYTEEQINTIRKLAEEAENAGTPLNDLLTAMDKPSGSSLLIDSFSNAIKGLVKILKAIGGAWSDVFPPATANTLYDIVEKIHAFSEKLIISDKSADNLRSTFKGLFSVVDLLGQAFKALFKFVSPVTSILGKLGSKLLEGTGALGEWLSNLDQSAKDTGIFGKTVQGIIDFLVKLKDTIVRVGGELKEGLDFSWLDSGKQKIGEFLKWIKEKFKLPGFEEISSFFSGIRDNIYSGLDNFSAKGFIDAFNNTVKAIQEGRVDFDFLKDTLKSFKDGIGSKLSDMGIQFESFGNGLSFLRDNSLSDSGNGFARMINGVLDALTRAKDFLTEHIDIGALATIGFGGAFIFLMKKMSDGIELISKPLGNIGKILGAASGVLGSVSLVLKGFAKLLNSEIFIKYSEGIRNIAISIAILAGTLIALSNVDLKDMVGAGIALAALAAGLTLVSLAFAKFSSSTNKISKDGITSSGSGAGAMLSFVVSIKILLSAMKDILDMPIGGYLLALGGLVLLGGALATAIIAIQRLGDGEKAAQSSFSMLAFAFSMKILIKTMNDLVKMEPERLYAALPVMASVIGMMAAMMVTANRNKVDVKMGAGVLAMASSVLLMIGAIKMIAKIEPDDLLKGIVVTGLLSLIVIGMAASLSSIQQSSGNVANVGAGVLALSGAFILMAEAIKILGKLNGDVLVKGLALTVGIGLIFTALIAVTKLAGDNAAKAGVSMLAMSGAMILMTGAIYLLGNIDSGVLSQGLQAVAGIGVIFSLLVAVTKLAGNAAKTVAFIAGSVTALAVVVALMSMIDPSGLFNATAAITVIMGMMALVIASTNLAKSAEKVIITLGIVVAGLGGIIYVLSTMPAQSVLASAGALSLLMLSLSASMVIVSKAGNVSMSAIGALALLEVAMAGIAVILWKMQEMNVNPSIETAASLSIVLLGMAGVTKILSTIGVEAAGYAIVGAAALDVVIALIGGLMLGIGALMENCEQAEPFIDKGIEVLLKIGRGFGQFFGEIVGGFVEGALSFLPALGIYLSAFMESVQPFLEGAKGIDESLLANIGSLVGAILLLSGAEFLTGIASFTNAITGGAITDMFGTQLEGLGSAVKKFTDALGGDIDSTKMDAAKKAVDVIMQISALLPRSGGAVGILFGDKQTLGSFGANLQSFGTALVNYSKAVSANGAINMDAVKDSATAAGHLAKLESGLSSSSGLLGELVGGNRDLSDFGTSLENFANGIVAYSKAVSGEDFDVDKITESVDAVTALSSAEKELAPDKGILGMVLGGNQSFDTFGSHLEKLGSGLVSYSKSISNGKFDVDKITKSVDAISKLSGAEKELALDKGILGLVLGGNQSFDKFAVDISLLGAGLVSYSKAISDEDFDVDKITKSVDAISKLSGAEKDLAPDKGLMGWLMGGPQGLDKFGDSLAKLGSGLVSYSKSVTENGGISKSAVDESLDIVEDIVTIATDLAAIDTQKFSDISFGLSGFGDALYMFCYNIKDADIESIPDLTSIGTGISALMDTVKNLDTGKLLAFGDAMSALGSQDSAWYMKTFSELGSDGVTWFTKAFADASEEANAAGVELIQNVINGIESKRSELENVSTTTVQGVVDGIQNSTPTAENATSGLLNQITGRMSAGIPDITNTSNQLGFSTGTGFGDGVISANSNVSHSVDEIKEMLFAKLSAMKPEFAGMGEDALASYTQGIDISQLAGILDIPPEMLSNPEIYSESGGLNIEALAQAMLDGSVDLNTWANDYSSTELPGIFSDNSTFMTEAGESGMDAYNGAILAKKEEAVAAMNEVLTAIQTAIASADESFSAGASGNMSAYLSAFQIADASNVDDGGAGQSLMSAFVATIGSPENTEAASAAFNGMIVAVLAVAEGSKDDFSNAGAALIVQFNSGMKTKLQAAKSTGVTIVSNVVNGIRSLGFITLGIDAAQGFINGMNTMRTPVWMAGYAMGRAALLAAKQALDSHSPSKEFMYLGQHAGEGYRIGINNWISPVAKTTSEMMNKSIEVAKKGLDAFEEWADERKFYGELAVMEELEGYKQLQKMYKEGSEERKKIDRQVYTLEKQIVKDTFEYSKNWLEKEEYYDRLTTEAKLSGWKAIQSRYMEGTEEREEANRQVYSLEKQLEDERYQERMDHIDNEVFYGRMGLREELAALEELQQQYEVNSEKWLELDKTIYSKRKQLEDERYQERMDHIDNEVFYGRMGLREELAALEELQKQYEVNSERWLELDKKIYSKRKEVVQDFYDQLSEYISNEKTFLRMGNADELGTILMYLNQFEEGSDEWKKAMTSAFNIVISMGEAQIQYEKDVADAQADHAEKRLKLEEEYAEKVKSINKKLEDDIESLNQKYEDAVKSRADSLYKSYGLFDEVKKKDEVSGDTLIKNLNAQVAEFDEWQAMLKSLSGKGVNADMIAELEQMGPSAIANVRALNGMTSTQLTQYVNLWATKHRQAKEQATGELEGMRVETQEKIAELRVNATKELDDYKTLWQTKMTELDTALEESLKELETDFKKSTGQISKYTKEEFSKMADGVSQIMAAKGYDIGSNLILGILNGYKERKPDLLEATQNITTGVMQPLAKNIESCLSSRVFSVSAEVSDNSLTDVYNRIYTLLSNLSEETMEFRPTIRPVVDLSDASSKFDEMKQMFSIQRSLELANRAYAEMNGDNRITVNVNNDDVVSAIGTLRGEMREMSETISNMKMVLDTGSLIGALAAPMDSALGRRQVYKGRGN